MMIAPQRSLFRESAIKRYRQKQEQTILLRVASPPIILFFWAALLLLLGATGFAWTIRLPVQVQGQGVIVAQGTTGQIDEGVVGVLFFAPDQVTNLHPGQPATVSIGSMGLNIPGSVEHIETSIISPDEARSRFHLQGGLAQIITEPSTVVFISIGSAALQQIYAGSLCMAQIQVGSRSVLSLL